MDCDVTPPPQEWVRMYAVKWGQACISSYLSRGSALSLFRFRSYACDAVAIQHFSIFTSRTQHFSISTSRTQHFQISTSRTQHFSISTSRTDSSHVALPHALWSSRSGAASSSLSEVCLSVADDVSALPLPPLLSLSLSLSLSRSPSLPPSSTSLSFSLTALSPTTPH